MSGYPTAERLKELLEYCPVSGIFRWKQDRSIKTKAGDAAGCTDNRGYVKIGVDGNVNCYAHRLAWLWMTGSLPVRQIDHRDTDKSNNSWQNLRLASPTQNNCNTPKSAKNSSGFKGVHYSKSNKGYVASICAAGVSYHLGTFETPEAAHIAYSAAAKILHGKFARAA